MVLEKIPLNDGYEIRVECEDELYSAQGFLNGEPVTEAISKSVLQASVDSLDKSAKDFNQSTAKAIDESGADESLTGDEFFEAISSKLPDKSVYQDIVSDVVALLKKQAKISF